MARGTEISDKTRVSLGFIIPLLGALVAGSVAYGTLRGDQAQLRKDVTRVEEVSDKERTKFETQRRETDQTLSELRQKVERIDVLVMWMADEMRSERKLRKQHREEERP